MTAADGEEALGVYRRHADTIVCVLLDLIISGLSGDVRVVLSSGYDMKEIARRFKDHGPPGFIQKPYTMEASLGTLWRAAQ